MALRKLNVLIVDGDIDDFALINNCLNKAFNNPAVIYCPLLEKAVEISSAIMFDVMIICPKSDQSPEDEVLNQLLTRTNYPAILILADYANGTEAILAGAEDCISKENLNSNILYKSITYAVARRMKNLQTITPLNQYKTLFDKNPLPILVYEIDSKKIFLANQAAAQFYGYSIQEFAEMPIFQLQPENSDENIAHSFAGQKQHQLKNGQLIRVEVLTNLVHIDQKTYRLAVVIDQTKRNEPQPQVPDDTQQKLLLLQLAINNCADGIIITQNTSDDFCSSEIVYSNPAFNRLTGYTAAEIRKLKPDFIHKKHPVKEASAYDQPKTETFETRLINYKNNKSDCWVDYSISPVEDNQGRITHFVAVYRDASVRRKTEAENETTIRELQESNQELKQFSYVISHNLRAPLANLTGLLGLLDTDTITDADTLELIEAVKTSTNQLNITVNDIIDVLMIKSEEDKIAEPVAIAASWSKVKATVAYQIDTAKPVIAEDFTEAPIINFKESYLESVLLNLLSNALKYKSDERRLVINLKTYEENGSKVLIFEDNGIGIDMNKYGHQVFGLYKRFTNRAEGKGLGLYIVHAQIAAYGGKIEVKSELNKGTRFTIVFKKE